MHQNDGVSFTSSSLNIPLPSPSQTLASQLAGTRHLAFQLIDSLRFRSSYVKDHSALSCTVPTQSVLGSGSNVTTSPLFCSASLSLASEKRGTGRSPSPLLDSASLSLTQQDSTESARDGHLTAAGRVKEERVLVSEILIRNKDGEELERKELEMEALTALKACGANSALTTREVQEDVDRIIDSGYFSSCTPVAVDSRDDTKLVFQVEPNQDFNALVCEGANVLPSKFLEDAFRDKHGKVINLKRLDEVISSINGWYMDRGLFGLVSRVDIAPGGIIRLKVSEAEVNDISVRFLDRKTVEPTKGKTKPDTILRQLTTKKGQVYSMLQGKRDVDTVSTMGLGNVSILTQSAGDGNVDLIMNVVERPTGRFSAGAGISSGITSDPLSGLFGSFAYSERNFLGKNQKLNVSLEKGQIDSTFRINYTDPWIEGNDKRTSRTITVQNSRTSGTLVHGNQQDTSSLSIGRLTAGVEFSRPLRPKWSGTAGFFFQRAGARDEKGNPIIKDFYGSSLTASGKPYDDMLLAKLESIYTGSGNKGSSTFAMNMEQGLPVMPDWLYFNRVNARASKGVKLGPARLLLRLSGGHVVGHFPPHEAFAIGGTNSVRGYKEGAVGSGRSFIVGTSEVSLKLLGPVQGVIFADYGHDLCSGPNVPGNPAGARNKRGSGYGYGVGVRMDSPFGLLRLEYALNDRFSKRLHFALGQPK